MKVSGYKISVVYINISAESPRISPVKPPVIKVDTKPIANNMAGVNRILALQSVAK